MEDVYPLTPFCCQIKPANARKKAAMLHYILLHYLILSLTNSPFHYTFIQVQIPYGLIEKLMKLLQ